MSTIFANHLKRLLLLSFICAMHLSTATGANDVLYSNYIYQITRKNENAFYLFGSSHLTNSNHPTHLSQCVKDIFSRMEHLYLEADQLAAKSTNLPPRDTVPMRAVSPYLDHSIVSFLAEKMFGKTTEGNIDKLLKLDANTLLGVIFSRIPRTSEILGRSDFGLDTELAMSARFLNKKLDFIETPDDQFEFFRKMPPEVYGSAISTAVNLTQNPDYANSYFNNLINIANAAAKGDEEKITAGMKFDGLAEYYKISVSDRNESITEKIIYKLSKHDSKGVFIALGAAHLAGEGSVVQRLKTKGYTVMRLCQ